MRPCHLLRTSRLTSGCTAGSTPAFRAVAHKSTLHDPPVRLVRLHLGRGPAPALLRVARDPDPALGASSFARNKCVAGMLREPAGIRMHSSPPAPTTSNSNPRSSRRCCRCRTSGSVRSARSSCCPTRSGDSRAASSPASPRPACPRSSSARIRTAGVDRCSDSRCSLRSTMGGWQPPRAGSRPRFSCGRESRTGARGSRTGSRARRGLGTTSRGASRPVARAVRAPLFRFLNLQLSH